MKQRHNWAELATEAANEGDFGAAKRCFLQAIKHDKNNHLLRFHYGAVLEASGDRAGAAEQFTETLRIEPTAIDAARRLGRVVSMGLPGDVELNVWGLKAALTHHDFVNRDQIAEAAVYYLSRKDPLVSALELGRAIGWRDAARQLCLKKTAPLLRDDLLLLALRDNIVRMPDLELLLTEIRRVLLVELPHARFDDRALAGFLAALMHHCWVNEYVWPVTAEETEALGKLRVDTAALFQGSAEAGLQLAIAALYQPVSALIGDNVSEEQLARVRPHVIGEAVGELVRQHDDERARAAKMPKLGSISDPTSVKVAEQYSRYPYPRWTSLGFMLRPGEWRKIIEEHFSPERLAFMDKPFEVLIAGSGTGRQAIAEAHAYGPNARITAIDLSAPSLAYAGPHGRILLRLQHQFQPGRYPRDRRCAGVRQALPDHRVRGRAASHGRSVQGLAGFDQVPRRRRAHADRALQHHRAPGVGHAAQGSGVSGTRLQRPAAARVSPNPSRA